MSGLIRLAKHLLESPDIVRAGAPQKRIMITAGVSATARRAIKPTSEVTPAAEPRALMNSIHTPVSIACMYSIYALQVYRDQSVTAVSYCIALG